MSNNEPLRSVENIVQLQSARRIVPVPTSQLSRAQPTPAVLFTSWVATRDRAAAALLGGTRLLLLTGPAGTGKTVLIEHVARVLRAAGRTVIVQLADADPAPPGAGVTLFVDEADRLSADKLKQLVDHAAGAVVLTGLAPLVRRVGAGTTHLALEPLGQVDAQEYIAQWLALNGRTTADLDSNAVRALVELSGGVPRLLSTLLAAGSWLAKNGNAPVIEAVHIQEAAALRSVLGPPSAPVIAIVERPPVRSRRLLWSALLTSAVVVGAAAAIAPHLFPAETERAVALAGPFVAQAERWLRAAPSAPPPRPVETAAVAIAPPPVIPIPVQAAPPPVASAAPVDPSPVVEPAAEPPKAEAAAEPVKTPSEPVKTPSEPAQPAPEPVQAAAAPPVEPVPDVKTPEVAAIPAPVPPPVAAPTLNLPVETIEFLLRRGREMLAIEDLSAARLLFIRAAEGGSAEAMFELGQTYDAAFLTGIGAVRQADRAEAIRWYGRAAAKGNRAAERLLPRQ